MNGIQRKVSSRLTAASWQIEGLLKRSRGPVTPDDVIEPLTTALAGTVEVVRHLGDELKALRGYHANRVSGVRSLSYDLLVEAKNLELVERGVVDAELERRARNVAKMQRAPRGGNLSGAGVSGYMPCSEAGCDKLVNLSAGRGSACVDHPQAMRRTYLTPNYGAVDLDAELADAQTRAKAARDQAEAAEAEVARAEERVAEFDAAR